jgi:hypothetical protein
MWRLVAGATLPCRQAGTSDTDALSVDGGAPSAAAGSKHAFIHLKVAGPVSYDFDRVFSTNV